jgi:hypothetical protein
MLRCTSLLGWITSLVQWFDPIKDRISEREASVSTPKAEWSDKIGTVVNNSLNMINFILWASPVLTFYFSTARSRIVALYCSALWATLILLSSYRSPIKSTSLESTLQSLSESTYRQGAICFLSVRVCMWKVSNALPYGTIVSQRVATSRAIILRLWNSLFFTKRNLSFLMLDYASWSSPTFEGHFGSRFLRGKGALLSIPI